MDLDRVYPYLVPSLTDPALAPACVPVGHGVWAQLWADEEKGNEIVHTVVTPERLRAEGVTPEEAHRRALDNLDRFAEADPNLSIQVLGAAGMPVHFLLYSDHPRAAACLRLPGLYEEACERLGTTEVCAVVPQRESLVLLPKRDRAYRELIVGKLRELEADAKNPISFALFELTADGVREMREG